MKSGDVLLLAGLGIGGYILYRALQRGNLLATMPGAVPFDPSQDAGHYRPIIGYDQYGRPLTDPFLGAT
mgnify:CR=1 FL=1